MTDDGRTLALGAAGALALAGVVASVRGSAAQGSSIHNVFDVMGRVGVPIPDVIRGNIAQGGSWMKIARMLTEASAGQSGAGTKAQRIAMLFDAYVRSGEQTFVIGPRLRDMLLATDLSRVPPETVQLPYSGFYIALPDSGLRLYHFLDNAWRDVVGAYVADLFPLTGTPGVGIWIWARPDVVRTPEDLTHYEDAWLYIDPIEAAASEGGMEGWIDQKLWEGTEHHGRFRNPMFTAAFPEVSQTYRKILRLVVNALLYINSGGADLSVDPHAEAVRRHREQLQRKRAEVLASNARDRSKRREVTKIDAKLSKLSGATVTWLGRGIEEARGQRAAGYAVRGHWRRGHWKLPYRKHGPRVLTWVQPYPVGTERAAKVTKRTYRHLEDEPDGQE